MATKPTATPDEVEAARIRGALDMLITLFDKTESDWLINDDNLRELAVDVGIPFAALAFELARGMSRNAGPWVTTQDVDELDAAPLVRRIVWERCAPTADDEDTETVAV